MGGHSPHDRVRDQTRPDPARRRDTRPRRAPPTPLHTTCNTCDARNARSQTFGPSSWENVDGWEEGGQDISEYYGVTVSTEGTLIRIKLTKNNLEGGLPETIGQLTALMILNLSSNFIEGPLPPSITDMVSLNKLELSRNRFSGEIPETIGEMTNLKKIVLQNNKFSGEIPKGVCSIAALLHCDFSRNDLIGTVPEEFGYMDGLRALLINDNRMTGDVPESLTLLTNIEVLRLEFNKFEIDPHWLVEVNFYCKIYRSPHPSTHPSTHLPAHSPTHLRNRPPTLLSTCRKTVSLTRTRTISANVRGVR